MSYWSHHPEKYEEIIVREMIRRGLATEDEEPEVVMKRFEESPNMLDIDYNATADYWGDKIDEAWERHKREQMG